MTAAARDRLHRFRARQHEGKAVLRVEIDLFRHTEMLVHSGFLAQWDDNNRAAIEAAIARLLRAFAEETRFQISVGDRA
jgi:hypothetical protein